MAPGRRPHLPRRSSMSWQSWQASRRRWRTELWQNHPGLDFCWIFEWIWCDLMISDAGFVWIVYDLFEVSMWHLWHWCGFHEDFPLCFLVFFVINNSWGHGDLWFHVVFLIVIYSYHYYCNVFLLFVVIYYYIVCLIFCGYYYYYSVKIATGVIFYEVQLDRSMGSPTCGYPFVYDQICRCNGECTTNSGIM